MDGVGAVNQETTVVNEWVTRAGYGGVELEDFNMPV
jgi:hypothetical protein